MDELEQDPKLAFQALQELHGMEMARLAGDKATQSAYIYQLRQELAKAQERITALEQNVTDSKAKKVLQGGADLRSVEAEPKSPLAKGGGT